MDLETKNNGSPIGLPLKYYRLLMIYFFLNKSLTDPFSVSSSLEEDDDSDDLSLLNKSEIEVDDSDSPSTLPVFDILKPMQMPL